MLAMASSRRAEWRSERATLEYSSLVVKKASNREGGSELSQAWH
jgi:hypothetical protein